MRYGKCLLLLLPIILTPLLLTLAVKAEGKPIVVVYAKGMLEMNPQLKEMISGIPEVEWKVITKKEDFTFDAIKDAKMLIVVLVDAAAGITDEECAVIKKWFDQGGKTLWVCGDSDYKGGDYKRIGPINKILETVGSCLRSEHTEGCDAKSNCGKSYRVAALIKPDRGVKFLAEGVTKPVLFHGPGIVIAYVNGKYIGLEKKRPKNVYRIAWTSEGGVVSEFVPPVGEVHKPGYKGPLVLMAAEVFPEKKNIVILSAEAPFDHYRGMWITSYHGVALDGPTFVRNVVLWGVGLKGKIPAGIAIPILYIVIIIVIIIIIVAVVLAVRRRKK